MPIPTITAFNTQAQTLTAPAQALSRLAVANCEQVAALQMTNLQVFMAIGFEQVHAALSIKDAAGLQTFASRQGPLLARLGEKAAADGQALTRMATEFGAEVQRTMLTGAQSRAAA